ncbi:hypothetical protein [Sporolactobacillus sp. KGMB 08714]|uniref:hypothetical protein n=1 Tax=Sporolactobacillus sp. KGMB 08714 TaxID=3064704 RepID=UPI002FBEB181
MTLDDAVMQHVKYNLETKKEPHIFSQKINSKTGEITGEMFTIIRFIKWIPENHNDNSKKKAPTSYEVKAWLFAERLACFGMNKKNARIDAFEKEYQAIKLGFLHYWYTYWKYVYKHGGIKLRRFSELDGKKIEYSMIGTPVNEHRNFF